jgi:phosphate transport system substrate-binding protein
MNKRLISVVLVIALGLTACGSDAAGEAIASAATAATVTTPMSTTEETTPTATTKAITTTVTSAITKSDPEPEKTFPIIDGSTSTIKLDAYIRAELLGISLQDALYDTKHNKTFEAFENLVNGKADIVLSVPLAKEQEAYAAEKNFEYEAVPVALEGFVFLVNPKNPVQSLTQEQIRKIYSGEITNWKELGGNDAPIEAYQRNGDSGSQTYMVEFMGEIPLTKAPKTMVQLDMAGVISMFSDYNNSINAIGYSVYSYAALFAANEGAFNFVAVDGIKPSRTTFIDRTYPLLSETYAFYKKGTTDKSVTDYIKFITSEEGQNAVLEAGYIPVKGIDIPAAYTLYEAKGTGAEKPENINNDYYYLNLNYDYDFDIRPRGFLKDAEFEAEIQAWIDEAVEYYFNKSSSSWYSGYDVSYNAEIRNGYLGISVGRYETDGVGAFWEFCGNSAVFDLYKKKKVENLSDLFYKDVDFMPSINRNISAEIMNKTHYDIPIEFFGLCYGFSFDLSNINFQFDNAYAPRPLSFDMRLNYRGDSVVSECRDFKDLITSEFADKIELIENTNSPALIQLYYEKNGHIYSYFDYPDIENDRELPENKGIEEMFDEWYTTRGFDNASIKVNTQGVFIYLNVFGEGERTYCTIEHKFLEFDDFFKEGYEKHIELNPNVEIKSKETASEIFEKDFLDEYSSGKFLNIKYIASQISEANNDNYIKLSTNWGDELHIDKKWLKDIYQNLPNE